jgi:peptidoglycan-associated lipoprotein
LAVLGAASKWFFDLSGNIIWNLLGRRTMIKSIKILVTLFAVVGLLSACGSNNQKEEADAAAAQQAAQAQAAADEVAQLAAEEEARLQTDADAALNVAKVFYFAFDQSILDSDARAALTVHAEVLKNSPRSLRLEGHADERGSREYNMALGERRANAARDFLVLQGVDASLIETVSYGEESPAQTGSYEGSWSKNRRVELK